MNRPRDDLFARAGLSQDQYGDIRRGHQRHPFHDLSQPTIRSNNLFIDLMAAQLFHQQAAVGIGRHRNTLSS